MNMVTDPYNGKASYAWNRFAWENYMQKEFYTGMAYIPHSPGRWCDFPDFVPVQSPPYRFEGARRLPGIRKEIYLIAPRYPQYLPLKKDDEWSIPVEVTYGRIGKDMDGKYAYARKAILRDLPRKYLLIAQIYGGHALYHLAMSLDDEGDAFDAFSTMRLPALRGYLITKDEIVEVWERNLSPNTFVVLTRKEVQP